MEEELARIRTETPAFIVGALKERELVFTNSFILHELYFGNLGDSGRADGAAAAKYIDAFFQNINWDEVNRRLQRAEKAAAALRA